MICCSQLVTYTPLLSHPQKFHTYSNKTVIACTTENSRITTAVVIELCVSKKVILNNNPKDLQSVQLLFRKTISIDKVSNVKIRLLQYNLLTAVTCWTNSHLNTAAVAINSVAFLA